MHTFYETPHVSFTLTLHGRKFPFLRRTVILLLKSGISRLVKTTNRLFYADHNHFYSLLGRSSANLASGRGKRNSNSWTNERLGSSKSTESRSRSEWSLIYARWSPRLTTYCGLAGCHCLLQVTMMVVGKIPRLKPPPSSCPVGGGLPVHTIHC